MADEEKTDVPVPEDGDGASAYATAMSLADRVEWHAAAGEDMAVVMEFCARGRDCLS